MKNEYPVNCYDNLQSVIGILDNEQCKYAACSSEYMEINVYGQSEIIKIIQDKLSIVMAGIDENMSEKRNKSLQEKLINHSDS